MLTLRDTPPRDREPSRAGHKDTEAAISVTNALAPIPHPSPLRLTLLGGFLLEVAMTPVTIPSHAQRVLAYLSVHAPSRPVCPRGILAERLWADSSPARSQASLRTALWRIRQADSRLIKAVGRAIRLGDQVRVDLHDGLAWADRLLASTELTPADIRTNGLLGELLPGWDEEWLVVERERIRQLRVHALDALARRLLRSGRHSQAVAAALEAVAAEPLRESAQATLIDIYLDEGNASERCGSTTGMRRCSGMSSDCHRHRSSPRKFRCIGRCRCVDGHVDRGHTKPCSPRAGWQ